MNAMNELTVRELVEWAATQAASHGVDLGRAVTEKIERIEARHGG